MTIDPQRVPHIRLFPLAGQPFGCIARGERAARGNR
jgi:hypothetical protein